MYRCYQLYVILYVILNDLVWDWDAGLGMGEGGNMDFS